MQPHLANLSRHINLNGDWPCIPRSRPMAFPNATHDMPELCSSFGRYIYFLICFFLSSDHIPDLNLMDWSITDQMAVSFGQDVIVWHNRDETTMVFSVKNPRALRYSKNGKYLAIGCTDHGFPGMFFLYEAYTPQKSIMRLFLKTFQFWNFGNYNMQKSF